MLLSKSQNKWDIFFKLWPSHNDLTLFSKLFLEDMHFFFFLVITNNHMFNRISRVPAKYALGGEIHSVSKQDRGGENIYSFFFFAHTPTIKVILYKSRG